MSFAASAARRIHPAFVACGWTWSVRDGKKVSPFIPSVEELTAAYTRLRASLTGEDGSWASGRLYVDQEEGWITYGVSDSLVFEEQAAPSLKEGAAVQSERGRQR